MSKEIVTKKLSYEHQEEFRGELVMNVLHKGKKIIARFGSKVKKTRKSDDSN